MDISNQRKGSAPPSLNTRNNASGINKSHADTVRNHICNDNIYQERVNRSTAKIDNLIKSHKKAQQVNNGNGGSPVINNRSISLGNMGSNTNVAAAATAACGTNGFGSGSNSSSRERTPSIDVVPPSPVIKRQQDHQFGFNAEPLTVSSDNGMHKS